MKKNEKLRNGRGKTAFLFRGPLNLFISKSKTSNREKKVVNRRLETVHYYCSGYRKWRGTQYLGVLYLTQNQVPQKIIEAKRSFASLAILYKHIKDYEKFQNFTQSREKPVQNFGFTPSK